MPIVAIVGPSGSGKSTGIFPNRDLGIIGLNPKETILCNVSGKPPAIRGWASLYAGHPKDGGNLLVRPKAADVVKAIEYANTNMPHIKNIVVDDAQYLQAFEYARRTAEKGFDKFTDIFNEGFKPLYATFDIRDDLFVFFNYHDETDKQNSRKIKTCGQMIDNTITIEGLFTEVLYTEAQTDFKTKSTEYLFRTCTNGSDTCKSRVGVFPDKTIKNDYGLVKQFIEKYNKGE